MIVAAVMVAASRYPLHTNPLTYHSLHLIMELPVVNKTIAKIEMLLNGQQLRVTFDDGTGIVVTGTFVLSYINHDAVMMKTTPPTSA